MTTISFFNQLMPEAILVLTALVLLGVAVAHQAKRGNEISYATVSWMAVAGMLLAGLSMIWQPLSVGSASLVTIDPLAQVFKMVILGLGALAILLPPAKDEFRNPGEFVALMLFAICGLLLAVSTQHLLLLFVALELASLSLYLLVGFPRSAKAAEVSLKYFLFGGVSAAFMLFGLSLIYGHAHVVSLPEIAVRLQASGSSLLLMAGLVMVLVGIGFKLAAAPFHYWAPDVYQGGSATSVALISAASKAVGMVVLVRILMVGFESVSGSSSWGGITAGWAMWLGVLAAVSMILGNLLALAQMSVRRLLAYSAVANTGYLLVGVCAHGSASAGAALFYVVVYGLATLGALAVTAAVERDRGDDSMASFAGLIHRSPMQAVALLLCLSSLAGIPPMAGFAGKFALFSKALADSYSTDHSGLFWLVILGATLSAISLYYYLKVLKQAFVKGEAGDTAASELPLGHRLAIGIPAVALLLLGLCPSMLMKPISAAVLSLISK